MAINISTDIVVTTGGKLSSVTQIQGGWQSVDTYSTMAALTGSSTLKGKLANGQLFYVVDEDQLYKCTISGTGPLATYSFGQFLFPDGTDLSALNTFTGSAQTSLDALNASSSSYALKTDVSGAFTSVSSSVSTRLTSLEVGGGSVPAGTISSSTQISDFGFISSSQAIATDISGAFTSLSSSISTRLTSVEGASGGDVTALNLFTGSAQTSLNALNAASSSYALKTDVSGAFTSVSGGLEIRITTLEGTSGGDVTALNLFTSSIQTQVNNLTSATSSYVTNSETSSFAIKTDISGAFVAPSSSISTRLTSLEAGGGSVPSGTISSSQQITNFGFISSSAPIASEISGAFTSVSGGLAGRITTLEGTSGGDVTSLNLFTASIQTQVDSLIVKTGSYATTGSNTFIGTEIVSGSLKVSGSFVSNNLTYPTVDGGFESQVLKTNAVGTLSFGDVSTIYETIYNGEATSLVKGTPVYVSGSNGAAPIVYRADAGNPAKMPVVYVVSEEITAASEGRGIVLGLISGIDLTGYTAGQDVYVAVGGGWTSTRPTGSATVQFLGIITKPGSGGQGMVLNPGAVALPNLNSGSIWVGGSSGVPTQILTSSLSVLSALTASYISPTFISASAAASGFGSGAGSTIPAGTVSSSAQVVANLIGQNVVVSSITAETFVVSSSVSYITTSFSSGSTKFGDDLNDTHEFTGSLLVTGSITANTFIGNLNYDYITNLPNLISSSAQIVLLGAGILSSSAQIATDISGAFISLSSSFASRIAALEAASPGGGSSIFALTGSFYSTTNNLQITGSLSVGSGSFKSFEVDSDGFVVLGDMDKDLNNAPVGTIVYSGSSFYLIS